MNRNKQRIAIIGASGQVGSPITSSLLKMGHDVLLIVRKIHDGNVNKLKEFQSRGAILKVVNNIDDSDELASYLTGFDALVCAVPGNRELIKNSQERWLEAAVKAKVKRFVPTEFGCHTMGLDYGDGILFDCKKDFHKKLLASGIGWTLIYNGLIYDYCLPNLRFFDKITTFGNMDIPIYTHDINDIGEFAARTIVDERTINKCVQMDYQSLSQNKMLKILKESYLNFDFEYKHYSEEFIKNALHTSSDEITAKKGLETDRERWGINNVIYVINKLVSFNDYTLKGTELYPDFKLSRSAEEAIKDSGFVFE